MSGTQYIVDSVTAAHTAASAAGNICQASVKAGATVKGFGRFTVVNQGLSSGNLVYPEVRRRLTDPASTGTRVDVSSSAVAKNALDTEALGFTVYKYTANPTDNGDRITPPAAIPPGGKWESPLIRCNKDEQLFLWTRGNAAGGESLVWAFETDV